jgi:hypothetical protein
VVMFMTGFLYYPKFKAQNEEATISWDVFGYYLYLPATFIYKDIKQLHFVPQLIDKYSPAPNFDQAAKANKTGNYVLNYSMGQAVTMLPWFTIADLWASNSNYLRDGLSYPYQACIGIGMFLYALLGITLFRKNLQCYFSDNMVALGLLILVVGSNYLNYAAIDQALTHNVLFTIYNAIIFFTIRFHKQATIKSAILIGLLCGLAVLIRPSEIICVLIPLLWDFTDWRSFKIFMSSNYKLIFLSSVCLIFIGSFQLIYWKYVAGDWLYYSYRNQTFNFLSPHINNFCFAYGSGWLRYTPIFIFSLIGLIPLVKTGKNKLVVISIMLLSFYIVTSWNIWNYGGLSGRAMVQYYTFFIIPILYLFKWVNDKRFFKWLMIPSLLICGYINIWFTGITHGLFQVQFYNINKAYYWATLGKWSQTNDDIKLLDNAEVFNGEPSNVKKIQKYSAKLSIDSSTQFSNSVSIINKGYNEKWLRVSANFLSPDIEYDVNKQSKLFLKFYYKGQDIKSNMLRPYRFMQNNQLANIHSDAKLPKQWDSAEIIIHNDGCQKQLTMDNISIAFFD